MGDGLYRSKDPTNSIVVQLNHSCIVTVLMKAQVEYVIPIKNASEMT